MIIINKLEICAKKLFNNKNIYTDISLNTIFIDITINNVFSYKKYMWKINVKCKQMFLKVNDLKADL